MALGGHDIVVIGASAGGLQALMPLLEQLPADFPAAVFAVLHRAPGAPALLDQILSRHSRLPVFEAEGDAPITPGTVRFAPPDRHLVLEADKSRVVTGPRENRYRPSIDVLFRSAAHAHGPRVAGVVLSGALWDGTAGLAAVKRHGGLAAVQDPNEAMFPEMPRSALQQVSVDAVLGVADLAVWLDEAARDPVPAAPTIEDEAARSAECFTCPDCGGPMRETGEDGIPVWRCLVGHGFGPERLLELKQEGDEHAIWAALRALDETARLARRMAERATGDGSEARAAQYRRQADEADANAQAIRRLLAR